MHNLKIKTQAYTELPIDVFPTKFSEIINAIISRPEIFGNLPVLPSILQEAANAMMKKTSLAFQGNKTSRGERDLQRQYCISLLHLLANFVLLRASQEQNEAAALSIVSLSKFTAANQSPKVRPQLLMEGVKVRSNGRQGEALVSWKRIPSIVSHYTVEVALTNPANVDTEWKPAGTTSRSKLVISGLPMMSYVWVRVIAHGYGKTSSPPSAPAMGAIF